MWRTKRRRRQTIRSDNLLSASSRSPVIWSVISAGEGFAVGERQTGRHTLLCCRCRCCVRGKRKKKADWHISASSQRPLGCSSYQRKEAFGCCTPLLDCYTGSRYSEDKIPHTHIWHTHTCILYVHIHTQNAQIHKKITANRHLPTALVARVTVAAFSLQRMEVDGGEMSHRLLVVTYRWPSHLPPFVLDSPSREAPVTTGHSCTCERCVRSGWRTDIDFRDHMQTFIMQTCTKKHQEKTQVWWKAHNDLTALSDLYSLSRY